MRVQRSRVVAAVVVCLALVMGGCARSVSVNDPGVPGPGGFLRIGTIAVLSSLNPWITDDQLALDIESDIYPRILQYNLKTLDFEPSFATKWQSSNGGRTWTFTTPT